MGYRRGVVGALKGLRWLDDRPVGEEERRGVQGWLRAGREGEVEEREKVREEKRAKEARQWQQWKDSRTHQSSPLDKRVHYSSTHQARMEEVEEEEGEGEKRDNEATEGGIELAAVRGADEEGSGLRVETGEGGEEDGEYHVMMSQSIEAFYRSVQATIPSTAASPASDSDDDEEAEGDEEGDGVPFLLGLTPVLPPLSPLPHPLQRRRLRPRGCRR